MLPFSLSRLGHARLLLTFFVFFWGGAELVVVLQLDYQVEPAVGGAEQYVPDAAAGLQAARRGGVGRAGGDVPADHPGAPRGALRRLSAPAVHVRTKCHITARYACRPFVKYFVLYYPLVSCIWIFYRSVAIHLRPAVLTSPSAHGTPFAPAPHSEMHSTVSLYSPHLCLLCILFLFLCRLVSCAAPRFASAFTQREARIFLFVSVSAFISSLCVRLSVASLHRSANTNQYQHQHVHALSPPYHRPTHPHPTSQPIKQQTSPASPSASHPIFSSISIQ